MKTKKMILSILAIIFSVLVYIPFALDYIKTGIPGYEKGSTYSTVVKGLPYAREGALLNLSIIFFYVAVAVASLLILLLIANMLIKKNRYVQVGIKIVSILLIVSAIACFGICMGWCIKVSSEVYSATNAIGNVMIGLAGLFAGIFGLLASCKKAYK